MNDDEKAMCKGGWACRKEYHESYEDRLSRLRKFYPKSPEKGIKMAMETHYLGEFCVGCMIMLIQAYWMYP